MKLQWNPSLGPTVAVRRGERMQFGQLGVTWEFYSFPRLLLYLGLAKGHVLLTSWHPNRP